MTCNLTPSHTEMRCHGVCTAFWKPVSKLWGRREIRLNIKFASNSIYITSSKRLYSVHTTFPQRLYSVHGCSMARKKWLQGLFWACPSSPVTLERRSHSVSTALKKSQIAKVSEYYLPLRMPLGVWYFGLANLLCPPWSETQNFFNTGIQRPEHRNVSRFNIRSTCQFKHKKLLWYEVNIWMKQHINIVADILSKTKDTCFRLWYDFL